MFLTREVQDFLRGRHDAIHAHKSGPATQAYLAEALLAAGQNVVVVLPESRLITEMESLTEVFSRDHAQASGGRRWFSLPACPPEDPLSVARSPWPQRWLGLHALCNAGKPLGLLVSVENLLFKWPSRKLVQNCFLVLAPGEEMRPEDIVDQAVSWGYQRTSLAASVGEVARRGDVLDIFPPGFQQPMRMEFFGQTMESLRLFDPLRQRSIRDLDRAVVLPVASALSEGQFADRAREMWRAQSAVGELSSLGHSRLELALDRGDGLLAPGIFHEHCATLDQLLPGETVYLLAGSSQLRPRLEEAEWAWQTLLDGEYGKDGRWLRSCLLQPSSSARRAWHGRRQVVFEDLAIGVDRQGVELAENIHDRFEDLFWRPESRRRPWSALVQSLRNWREERPQVVLSFHGEHSLGRFAKRLDEEGISFREGFSPQDRGLMLALSGLHRGMDLEWNGVLILAEDVLQPDQQKDSERKRRRKGFVGLAAFEELSRGDLIVHRDYGLGRFEGLHRLRTGEAANDYLLVSYAGRDKLYLPVDRLNLVQRYKGPEGEEPALDRLGGSRWSKTKERARKAVAEIARDLVEIYAYRRIAKGYAYGPTNEMYRDFEASFGFEETPDQSRAIDEVFTDMDLPQPMDRLVCGDVGFGKTEVAMRSSFRAVLDGKQVALLCPTTVLAEQHYQNFRSRMEDYPVRVAMLSRFVPPARQKRILEAAAKGSVDILIGTHRLLSDDVRLPNLGLLILDEEQRFGVKHKEKLKKMRKNVDVLTLAATPIPRTLQLSLSGIRSLSVIETPPVDRKPVQTFLLERDPKILGTAVAREIERGGQVFWVHNRVQGLDEVEDYVRSLAPRARVGQAHGQMSPARLEESMRLFWHGDLDILVCTAIIESGLDFPRANTLIVDQAQMFGLGQLYQLRGRVGRSDRQAYAYFVVHSMDTLAESSRKRLQVILDMDYLGAGFFVAMEDLRLRGAGNILGESQSGMISKVGLELFLEMLENEVRWLKGEAPREEARTEMNVAYPANIPEDYVPETRDRLHYYKALSSAATDEAAADIGAEIRDRFGQFPEELETFIAVLALKRLLGQLGAVKADLFPGKVFVTLTQDANQKVLDALAPWVMQRQERTRILAPGRVELRFPDKAANTVHLKRAVEELSELCPNDCPPDRFAAP